MFIDYNKKIIFFKSYRVMGSTIQFIMSTLSSNKDYFLSGPLIDTRNGDKIDTRNGDNLDLFKKKIDGFIDINTYEKKKIFSKKNFLLNLYLKYFRFKKIQLPVYGNLQTYPIHFGANDFIKHHGKDKLKSFNSFSIVRNPFDRLLSLYFYDKIRSKIFDKVSFEEYLIKGFYKFKKTRYFKNQFYKYPVNNKQEYKILNSVPLSFSIRGNILTNDYKFLNSELIFSSTSGNILVNKVFKYEEKDQLIKFIAKIYNKDVNEIKKKLELTKLRTSQHSIIGKNHKKRLFTNKSIDLIYENFNFIIKKFNYDIPDYL
jgi:hypothetical protein